MSNLQQLRAEATSRPLTTEEVKQLADMHYGGVPVFPAGPAYFSDRFGPPDGLGRLSQGHADLLLKLEKEGVPVFSIDDLTETVGNARVFRKPTALQGALISAMVKATGGAGQFRPATFQEANVLYCDAWTRYK